MNLAMEPISKPSNRQQVAYVSDVLIQMQRLGSIHFVRSLPTTAFQTSGVSKQTAELSLPAEFVQENVEKIEEWVILRAHLSSGRSSRPWLVQLSFNVGPLEVVEVRIVGGWFAFVADNRLKEGDYLIFVLKEDARSEFEVYMFRGPWGTQYFPEEGAKFDKEEVEGNVPVEEEGDKNVSDEEEEDGSEYFPNEEERSDPEEEDDDEENYEEEDDEEEEENYKEDDEEDDDDDEEEENTNNQIRFHSPVRQQEEHNQVFIRDIGEGNPAPLRHTELPRVHPGFSRRLSAYNIGRSDGQRNSGQFEFPKEFLRIYGGQILDSVKFQGIHENSQNYVITCHRRPGNHLKVYCNIGEWSRFVHDNGLKEGHKLWFSLMAESYFVVRKIA